ncbi:MAG: Mur ligase domain-containing protein, partial [Pseudomonadota bacterium]|nr:Mur ligase domain-containing protein [Pseudomonadota bacterium]
MSAARAVRLDELLRGIAAPARSDIVVSGLTQDSRSVCAGDAFVALAGARSHGIAFAPMAIAQGAVAVLAERSGFDPRFNAMALPGPGSRVPSPFLW